MLLSLHVILCTGLLLPLSSGINRHVLAHLTLVWGCEQPLLTCRMLLLPSMVCLHQPASSSGVLGQQEELCCLPCSRRANLRVHANTVLRSYLSAVALV